MAHAPSGKRIGGLLPCFYRFLPPFFCAVFLEWPEDEKAFRPTVLGGMLNGSHRSLSDLSARVSMRPILCNIGFFTRGGSGSNLFDIFHFFDFFMFPCYR
jgi:hypothetical protein